jgi:hypothetical protein
MRIIGQGLGYNPMKKEPYYAAIQIDFDPSTVTADIDINKELNKILDKFKMDHQVTKLSIISQAQ